MALWDDFDLNNYSGSGGLVDRLLASLGQQSQYQPSAGFPQSPMDANASVPAAPQNAPIAVGNYMMPRIGAGFPGYPAHDPQTGETIQPQQMQPQPQQQPMQIAPPQAPAIQPAPQSPLMAGFQSWAHTPVGNPMAALANGIAGMQTGRRTDPEGISQQNIAATIQTLRPILGDNGAILAAINPAYGQKLLEAKLKENDHQFGFQMLPDGAIVRQDPKTGNVAPVYQAAPKADFGVIGKTDGDEHYGFIDKNKRSVQPLDDAEERASTVNGPDGKPIAIPPGVDRGTFVKEVSRANAKAAAGEKTEVQAKSEMFANKMESAESILKSVGNEGTSFLNRVADGSDYLPGSATAGRYMQSNDYQKYKQASSNFITALLRQESGAAISKDEFTRYEKEYMPQPGDGKDVVAQKAEARRIAIEGMKKGAGPGYKSPTGSPASAADPLGIR